MKIAVLGCGNMGTAIIAGVRKKYGTKASIAAFDKLTSARLSLPRGVSWKPPRAWFRRAGGPDVVIIAVKPQDMEHAAAQLKEAAGTAVGRPLWLSIAAGVPIGRLEKHFGASARICRVMPNMPALIGEAVSAFALNGRCGQRDAEAAQWVLGACGIVVQVAEKQMDAVTGLSGSGPAYVYLFIEALIEGGVTAGLSYEVAKRCAVQTVIGAAKMAAGGRETPSELKARVMSPAGTTVRGLMELEKQRFKYGVIRAVAAAARRAAELGKK